MDWVTSSDEMLIQVVVWLNWIADGVGRIALAPIAWLPGWLSITVISILSGIVMLFVFKHTSHQGTIQWTRNQIKANLLALSLFKDDFRVGLRAQGRLVLAGGRLMLLSLVPMLVMLVPTCLLLGQLALWYQVRPLSVGEGAVVTVHVSKDISGSLPEVQLLASSTITVDVGPVRVPKQKIICWNVAATEAGRHQLAFEVDGQPCTKELAVGAGFMVTSQKRPASILTDVVLHPHEPPFPDDSPVRSIEIDYPLRSSWTSGSHTWLVYWFLVSMVAAFAVRPC